MEVNVKIVENDKKKELVLSNLTDCFYSRIKYSRKYGNK
ncbi:MAG: hypothetical protein CM1200mP33_7540 [Chloroflexota bacterium]|nr:MAG: hypothetical protein CM1200mP33_7540 [Chloroflexota bacterium]